MKAIFDVDKCKRLITGLSQRIKRGLYTIGMSDNSNIIIFIFEFIL